MYLDPVAFDLKYPNTGVVLGKGASGIVYHAGDHAVKIITSTKLAIEDVISLFFREVNAYNSISHPNIIKLNNWTISIIITDDHITIEGKLAFPIGKHHSEIFKNPDMDKYKYASVLLSVVAFLEAMDVAHNDIKEANMVSLNGVPTIIDFGLSSSLIQFEDQVINPKPIYTSTHRDPQVILGHAINAKAEIYPVGVMLAKVAGYEPYVMSNYPFKLSKTPDDFSKIIKDCIWYPVENRLTAYQIINEYEALTYIKGFRIATDIHIDERCRPIALKILFAKASKLHALFGDSARAFFLTLHLILRTIPLLLDHKFDTTQYVLACVILARNQFDSTRMSYDDMATKMETTFEKSAIIKLIIAIAEIVQGIINVPTYWDYSITDADLYTSYIELSKCKLDRTHIRIIDKVVKQYKNISAQFFINNFKYVDDKYVRMPIEIRPINMPYVKQKQDIKIIEGLLTRFDEYTLDTWDKLTSFVSTILYDPKLYKDPTLDIATAINIFILLNHPDIRGKLLRYLIKFDPNIITFDPHLLDMNPFTAKKDNILKKIEEFSWVDSLII
jgi:serine/threonine protein kinase